MTPARFTVSSPSSPLAAAQDLADAFEAHAATDPLAVTVNETDEAQNLWNVVAYYADRDEAAAACSALAPESVIAPVPDEDWVRKSLEGLPPVEAGRFYLHGSHDRARRRVGGTSLEIDAGTAFGTGHHGTTAGCLLALDGLMKRHTLGKVFDLGCGTGVLAIAAARHATRPVLATDIDAEAVRVTVTNARLNHLSPRVSAATAPGLHHSTIRRAAPFDLIFANILARPLASLALGLSHALAPGGHVILSGLTRDQLRWIKACYLARGFIHARTIMMGNWVALVMHKPGSKTKRPGRGGSGRLQAAIRAPGWETDA
jgi:ribosomal protein L11 methyltransferase